MSVVSITSAKIAKTGGETRFAETKCVSVCSDKIINIIKEKWPRKTVANVSYLTGTSERTVQFWLAGQTRMSIDAVVALLKTDAGYEILEAIMDDDCKAEWWVVTQTAQDVRKMRRDIKKQEDRIALRRAQIDMIDQLQK